MLDYWVYSVGVKMTDEKKFVPERAVTITTSIPYSMWLACKQSKESWNGLVIRGFEARKGFERLGERIRDNENEYKGGFERLQKEVMRMNSKIEVLEAENKLLRKQNDV